VLVRHAAKIDPHPSLTYICERWMGGDMLRNTTFNLPDDLVARAKSYAAAHGTTMTAIVREHLEAVTSGGADPIADDPLLAYSQGRLARNEAIRLLGLRDYAELLVALGNADLPLPLPPPHDVENQAVTFAKLWKQS
jgi:plasmid stability protein